MIPRYSRPEMTAIWEPENKFRIWFEIEAHACDAMAEMGTIPKAAAEAVWQRGKWDIERIDEIERETRHDVIAFLTNLAEHVGPEARFVHQGMTSSDVLYTCLAVQLTQAADLLIADLDALLTALERRAREHKDTVCIGRSHGIHAEPTTFGLKLAGHYAEFARCRGRMVAARAEIATCAISGAVGTFANIDPAVEAHVAAKLGLAVEPVSTQVIPRDRHAAFFTTLGIVAGAVEHLSIEIRHLQRTEVREAEEYFAPGQKGSSAMPHKRNPILTENLTGIARLVRARYQEVTALARGLPAPQRILEGAMQRVDDWAERLRPALARVMRSKDEAVTAQGRQLVQPGQYVEAKRRDLAAMAARLAAVKSAGDGKIERGLHDTHSFGQRLEQAGKRVLVNAERRIAGLDSLLESYSYKGVLERGFVLVRDASGAPVLAADALAPGDVISLSFRDDGVVGATVDSVGGDLPPVSAAKPREPKPAAAKKKPVTKDPADDPQGSLL